jgi:hypothetical protein
MTANAKPQMVGAMLGYRKTWENMDAAERAAIVAGEAAELRRGRAFGLSKRNANGWGFPGWPASQNKVLRPFA